MTTPLTLEWTRKAIDIDRENGRIENIKELSLGRTRYVYVIEAPKHLWINYEKGASKICYIGRSARDPKKKSRLSVHATGWIFRYLALTPRSEPFHISYCHPRRPNSVDSFADIEAFLIHNFVEKFGSRPLFNKRTESQRYDHEVEINNAPLFRRSKKVKNGIAFFGVSDEVAIEE